MQGSILIYRNDTIKNMSTETLTKKLKEMDQRPYFQFEYDEIENELILREELEWGK